VVWVATLQDLFTHGLPGSTAAPEARPVASVDPTTDLFEVPGHALFGGERVRFRATGAGAALPGGVNGGRYLAATPADPDFFSITLLDGTPVDITTSGGGNISVMVDIMPKLSQMLDARSSYVRAHFKAYDPVWNTPPAWAPMIVAQLVAYDAASILRVTTPQYSLEELKARATLAEEFCKRGDAGRPYDDGAGPIDATPAKAEMGPLIVDLQGRGFLDCEGDRA
jgi:hypothetical protein